MLIMQRYIERSAVRANRRMHPGPLSRLHRRGGALYHDAMSRAMTRRSFVGKVASAGVLAVSQQTEGRAGTPKDKPNILVILADQHRADCLGCYGNGQVRTPHLDALAADGVRFDSAFCPYPVCTPSRYSLLSGLYVHEHRGWTNRCTLPPGTATFPALLRSSGYRTAAVGKMHFTPTYLDIGFDRMLLAEQDGSGRWDDDYHRELRSLGLADVNDLEDQRSEYRERARPEYWTSFGAIPSNLPEKHHSAEWIGEQALRVLDEWTPEGNLLMVGFIKPHHPFDPPAEWCGAYTPEAIAVLPGWTSACFPHDLALNKGYFPHESLSEPALRVVTAYYYATISHIDAQIGRMLDLLKRKGLYGDTLVVYTADHGEYLGYHHLLLKGGYMYDPLVRVPLLLKYPGSERAGSVSNALTSNVDLAPTILGQTSCSPDPKMHGYDLARADAGRDVVFAEAGAAHQAMARSRRFKLIASDKPDGKLFYDLERDPLEQVNRYGDPALERERTELETTLRDWAGSHDIKETYVDENALVIDQPNVPSRTDNHRDEMAAYYRLKMEEWHER